MNNTLNFLQVWRKCIPVKSTRLFCSKIEVDESVDSGSHSSERTFNKIHLLGRVGKEPVVVTKEGKLYVKFPIATKNVWRTTNGETRERTEWHTVVSHDPKLINYVSRYVTKGQRLHLSGRLTYPDSSNNPNDKYAIVSPSDIISLSN